MAQTASSASTRLVSMMASGLSFEQNDFSSSDGYMHICPDHDGTMGAMAGIDPRTNTLICDY